MSTEKVITRYRMFNLCNIQYPDTGEGLYSEDKVIKALESLLKNGLTLSTIDPRGLAKSSKPTAIGTARHTVERWRSVVHIKGY